LRSLVHKDGWHADDFSQTVIAATGDHEVGDSAQTITSDPELLCQTADADAVTCRREHIASDGSGGGWIWVLKIAFPICRAVRLINPKSIVVAE